ncbi:MAG: glycosyltransferase [Rhodospirillales bacterium]
MNILQVSTFDHGGGAEKVAELLHHGYQAAGQRASLAVKRRRGAIPGTIEIPETHGHGAWASAWLKGAKGCEARSGRMRGMGAAATLMRAIARPAASLDRQRGIEDFHYPASRYLPDLPEARPDILQCHNLHGNYFDLRALADLSRRLPVVLCPHDCWLMTGHCAHFFDCNRWRAGCGQCPNLATYPAVRRDATDQNWARKREIFTKARVYMGFESRWLQSQYHQSFVAPAIIEDRIIHDTVDAPYFEPRDGKAVRETLGLGPDTLVLLFAANSIRQNEWKDYRTLSEALERIGAANTGRPVVLLALGDTCPDERIGEALIRYLPFERDPSVIAGYYHAADVYLHAAKIETFSLTIAEAMACGTPVVATAAGAVPERIIGLDHPAAWRGGERFGPDRATGVLVPPGDGAAMAEATLAIATDSHLADQLSRNAALEADRCYRIERQVGAYLDWFTEILESRKAGGF